MDSKTRFIELCSGIRREGVDELMAWLDRSGFYTAPASTRFHGAYEGGLCEHSVNVYNEFKRLQSVYPEIQCDEESARIITLWHDLCKVSSYVTEQRNRKNEQGQWEKYDAYAFKEKFCYGGHGSKSVFIVQSFIKLKPEEAVAINCHMGFAQGEVNDISRAFEMFPVAWLLHVADESATYILESTPK